VSTTRYEMVLVDRMGGPARSAASAIARLRAGVRGLGVELRGVGQGGARSFRQLQSIDWTKGLKSAGLGSIGKMFSVAGAVTAAVELAAAIGTIGVSLARSVVEMAAFRESSVASMEVVMGSSEAAGRSFRNAITIANQTPLDTRDVVGMYTRFSTAGFGERELEPLTAAATDLASAFGQQAGSSFSLVVSQMRAADRMDRGDLRQMLNAGINTGSVLDSIARQLNIQGRDERARRQNVLQAITRGQVRGDTGITAAMEAVSARLNRGGALGGYARRQSQTLTGALSNAQNAWGNLLLSMNTGQSPGLRRMADGINAFTDAMAPTRSIGRELVGIVGDFTEVFAGGIFGNGNTSSAIDGVAQALRTARPHLSGFFRGLMGFGQGAGTGFMGVMRTVMELVGGLGNQGESSAEKWARFGASFGRLVAGLLVFVGAVGAASVSVAGLFATLTSFGTGVANGFRTIPGQMVDGFITGLHEHWGRLTSELHTLAAGLPDPIRSALGIRSPSRVMMELGEHTARGFELGISGGQGGVGRAMSDLVGPVGAAPVAGALGGRGDINVSIAVQVDGSRGDAEEFGQRVGRSILGELVDLLGTLNAGPAPAPAPAQ